MRVLLDTNVLISYLLTPRRDNPILTILQGAFSGKFVLLMPALLLEELARALRRKRYLAERITEEEMHEFMDLLLVVSETIPLISEAIPAVTRDAKDDYLLAYALVGQADYLVTGDKDLLSLSQFENLKLLSPAAFLRLLENSQRAPGEHPES